MMRVKAKKRTGSWSTQKREVADLFLLCSMQLHVLFRTHLCHRLSTVAYPVEKLSVDTITSCGLP